MTGPITYGSLGTHFVYPCVIVLDRYGGVYSGATWIAWPDDFAPDEAQGGDCEAAEFWAMARVCGKGETPDKAYADLVNTIGLKEAAK